MSRIKYSYGCKKDTFDGNDYTYSPILFQGQMLPRRVNLIPKLPPCFDQLSSNSCVAQAVCAAVQYLDMSYGERSRLFNYFTGRSFDGSEDVDQGMQIRDGIKAAEKYGICKDSLWPFSLNRINSVPTELCFQDASEHQAIAYYRTYPEPLTLKSILASGIPIVFGFIVYSSFESKAVRQSGKLPMPKLMDRQRGRHAVLMVGYDDDTEEYIVRNSWGTHWGMKGNFTMPYKFVHSPKKYCDDFWVIQEIEK